MSTIHKIEPFGEIDFNKAEEEYTIYDYDLNGSKIWFDLIFENETVSESLIPDITAFITRIPELTATIKAKIIEDYQTGEIVKGYINHHFEECPPEELTEIGINTDQPEQAIKDEMARNIHLKRIGIYAEDETFCVFDYTLSEEITQYLVVVNTNKQGEIEEIVIES